jgi:LysR family glycine cleavage system transcriptional activator
MSMKLPPLNALKVFEVAARKLSFSQAAVDLCVTQGAVSKQIKMLEEHLKLELFDRTPRGLQLTEAGKYYLPTIMSTLEQIQSTTASLQQFSSEIQYLTLDISPSLSSLWMIPRLNKLSEAFPSLRLNLISGDGAYQFHQSSADIAIRCLPLSLSHHNAHLLIKETLLPIIHKDLVKELPINKNKDLLNYHLIKSTTRPQLWPQCFSNLLGDEHWGNTLSFNHAFEHFFMSLEAAKQKHGIALIPNFLAKDSLAADELINLLDLTYESGYGYYFLTPSYKQQNPLIQKLLAWFEVELTR